MTTASLQQQMTDEDRALFERGASMLKRLQAGEGFDEHWVPVGQGLLAVRRTVMAALHLKKARGGYYNDAFGKMVARTPYADMHKVERSNLLYCMEHLPDILEMRAGWTPTERAKINHPTSMAQRLREFLNRAPTEAPRRNYSRTADLKDKLDRAERAKLDLEERVASMERSADSGSLFDLKRDSAEDIAGVIVGTVPSKAQKIHEALGRALTRQKRPAG